VASVSLELITLIRLSIQPINDTTIVTITKKIDTEDSVTDTFDFILYLLSNDGLP
jgi:hypothetical protein